MFDLQRTCSIFLNHFTMDEVAIAFQMLPADIKAEINYLSERLERIKSVSLVKYGCTQTHAGLILVYYFNIFHFKIQLLWRFNWSRPLSSTLKCNALNIKSVIRLNKLKILNWQVHFFFFFFVLKLSCSESHGCFGSNLLNLFCDTSLKLPWHVITALNWALTVPLELLWHKMWTSSTWLGPLGNFCHVFCTVFTPSATTPY